MKVLVLGSGGREHAIADALVRSPRVTHVWVAPGNGGTAAIAENFPKLDIEDGPAVAACALDIGADLVVIGPEGPLVAGVADHVAATGIRVFGPERAGAAHRGLQDLREAADGARRHPHRQGLVVHDRGRRRSRSSASTASPSS